MPQYVVTADDRAWFRGAAVPGTSGPSPARPSPARSGRVDRAPECPGPGDARRARGPLLPRHVELGPRRSWIRWCSPRTNAPAARAGAPRCSRRSAVGVGGRPVHTAARRGRHRRARTRSGAPAHASVDAGGSGGPVPGPHRARRGRRRRRNWIGDHRIVDEFASDDELALDERGILACWAWDEIELATTVAGIQYTELRVDPPAFRRTS